MYQRLIKMAKKKDVKLQNPKFTIDLIDILSEKDPTESNKYLSFMVKQSEGWVDWLIDEIKNSTFNDMFQVIKDFEELSQKNLLENKDIYSYESNQEIVDAINEAKEKSTKSQVKKNETHVLYEDDRYLVLQPLTSRSSNIYGKATKWCVSSEQNNFKKYFNDYASSGPLIFFIDKSVKESESRENIFYKIAFHNNLTMEKNGLTIWDAKDSQLSAENMLNIMELIPGPILKVIMDAIKGKSNKALAEERGIKTETFEK